MEQDTQASGLDADIHRYERDSKRFGIKVARLRLTSRLVTAALAFAVLGATVDVTSIC